MCDGITCEYPHLTSGAGTDGIKCDDITQDDLNPDVFENVEMVLMI